MSWSTSDQADMARINGLISTILSSTCCLSRSIMCLQWQIKTFHFVLSGKKMSRKCFGKPDLRPSRTMFVSWLKLKPKKCLRSYLILIFHMLTTSFNPGVATRLLHACNAIPWETKVWWPHVVYTAMAWTICHIMASNSFHAFILQIV